jgi:hypothetical protein
MCRITKYNNQKFSNQKYINIKGEHKRKNIQAINFEESDSENENLRVGLIKCNTGNKQWRQVILIENQLLNFKLDSGSNANIMLWIIFKKLDMPYEVHTEKLEPYIVPTFETMGKVKFLIVENAKTPILGENDCEKLNLLARVPVHKSVNLVEEEKTAFVEKYSDVFKRIGRFENPIDIVVDGNAVPVSNPPRRSALTMSDRIKTKMDEKESKRTVSKVVKPNFKAWLNNMVVVEKPDGDIRICLDPRSLNRHIIRNYKRISHLDEI